MCEKEEIELWHKKVCLLGQCLDCRVVQKLLLYLLKTNSALVEVLSWQHYERVVVGINKEGLAKKKVMQLCEETIPSQLIHYL